MNDPGTAVGIFRGLGWEMGAPAHENESSRGAHSCWFSGKYPDALARLDAVARR